MYMTGTYIHYSSNDCQIEQLQPESKRGLASHPLRYRDTPHVRLRRWTLASPSRGPPPAARSECSTLVRISASSAGHGCVYAPASRGACCHGAHGPFGNESGHARLPYRAPCVHPTRWYGFTPSAAVRSRICAVRLNVAARFAVARRGAGVSFSHRPTLQDILDEGLRLGRRARGAMHGPLRGPGRISEGWKAGVVVSAAGRGLATGEGLSSALPPRILCRWT